MADQQAFARALQAYDAAGAQKADDKIVDFSTRFTCWGTEVDGDAGRVAVAADKRRQSFRLTLALLLSGRATKSVLQSLVGTLVHPLMHRRQLMCSLLETYVFLSRL